MPAEESTPAIVLRARDYAEADRIVTLLTRDMGKISGIAKGAKASRYRFERKLEPFSHVMLHFRRRPHGELVFITRAEAADLSQPRVDDDLIKIALGSYMLEMADLLTSQEAEAAQAYQMLSEALATLGASHPGVALRQAFELRFLEWAGFGLEFGRCRICAKAPDEGARAVYFIVARGGVVCERCRPSIAEGAIRLDPLSAYALSRLGAARLEDAPGLPPAGADGAVAIARFVASVIDRRLRSTEFLDSVLPIN
ncbi:MAG TPA: DNA repair protein RecO [Candidatus Binataceae bacterium]